MKHKIIAVFLSLMIVVCISLCFTDSYNTPVIYDKIVLDIRNKSAENLDDMYLEVVVPETFKDIDNIDSYSNKIAIPKVDGKSRLVVSLDQTKVSLPGMQLALSLHNNVKVIVDELHKDVGATIVVNVNQDGSLDIKEIYNRIYQKKDVFYYRKYKKIIDLI